MRRVLKLLTLSAAVAFVCAPTPARADGYVSPFVGVNFANNSGNGKANFGAQAGWMGGGWIGAEADFGYAPSFFGNQGVFGSNYVMDVTGNLIVGVPADHGWAGVRPYGLIGFGLIRSQVNGPLSGQEISNNDAGVSAGGGVMGFLGPHVGFRGDVRYFHSINGSTSPNGFNIDFGGFRFWRAGFGVVIR